MNGMKNAIMKVTYFLNGSIFGLLFFVILFYIVRERQRERERERERGTFYEKCSQNLTLEVKFVWKISPI